MAINRIEKGLEDINLWEQKFGKLFSQDVLNSRIFRREELRQYEQLLARNRKRLSADEKLYRKVANQKRRQLEKQLYPNPFIRLIRNLLRLGAAIIMLPIKAILRQTRLNKQEQSISSDLNKHGFSELKPTINNRVHNGLSTFNERFSESPAEKQILDYNLSYSKDGNGSPKLEGYSATLSLMDTNETRSLSVNDSVGITKEQANGLLHGRAVNTSGNNWKIPDINDKDPAGNIKIREVNIPDFDIGREVKKLPIKHIDELQLNAIVNGLKNGKRMDAPLNINGKERNVQLDANPLRRNLSLFENNRKTSLDALQGKEVKNIKSINMKPAPKINGGMRIS